MYLQSEMNRKVKYGQALTVSPIFKSAHFLKPGSGFPSWQVAVKERLKSSGWSHTDSSTFDLMFWEEYPKKNTGALKNIWWQFDDFQNKSSFALLLQ